MANRKVSIFVRFTENDQRKTVSATYTGNARLAPHPGGVFWIRWYEGAKQRWKRVGSDTTDALKAQMRQEAILSGESVPVEERSDGPRPTLAWSIEEFLQERSTQTDEKGLKSWRRELELFATVCGKTYLHEVARPDVFAYWKWYQAQESAPRTCYNRVQSLLTFLRNRGITGLLKSNEMPRFDEPIVDYYSREEVRLFFAACDSEERIRYQT